MEAALVAPKIPAESPSRLSQLKGRLQDAGIDLFKNRDLYEWLLDAMLSEYKQGIVDASKIYKEVYKLDK